MSKENINDLYPLSALFIHACGKKIESELMESLFKTYNNVEYLPKLGKMFCISADKLEEYLGFAGAVPAAAAEVKTEAVKEEVKEKEPAKEQVVDMDFDALFD